MVRSYLKTYVTYQGFKSNFLVINFFTDRRHFESFSTWFNQTAL